MPPGPDVRELQRNLVALGLDPGHVITIGGDFTWATTAAIQRWQHRLGLAQTGTIPLGQVAFLPHPVRIARVTAAAGTPVAPGAPVLGVTSTVPIVSVLIPVGQATVRPGNPVLVTLPQGTTVPGHVSAVSRVAIAASPGSQGTGPGQAATPVAIRLQPDPAVSGLDQAPVQVTITEQEHRGVLAVPVTALLGRPSGGYAVRLAGRSRRIVPVTTGLFDDATGLVEVSGPGLAPGLAVEVAAG
jgi:peptidoglycan hydrolase-like protein with peptidoglycan-binding domain